MDIRDYLKQKNIEFIEHNHEAVFTCEQAEKHCKGIKGIRAKNLFIKERKARKYFLVIMPADKKLDMKDLGEKLNQRIKFANEDELKQILNLTPGSVTPFGLINDQEHKVEVIIHKDIWESEYVSFHPNINTQTLELKGSDFHKYIQELENTHSVLDL